jgi:hypothetical protein
MSNTTTATAVNNYTDISFSQNWNKKLNCNYFTTIRLTNYAKYRPGNQYRIICKGEYIYKAQIIQVINIYLQQLTDYLAYQDTGYNRAETIALLQKMYPNYDFKTKQISIILLKQLEYETSTIF